MIVLTMKRENRRATRPSDSVTALVILEYFDEKSNEWKIAPSRYSFISDEKARAYANLRYTAGVKIRTSTDSTVTVTGA